MNPEAILEHRIFQLVRDFIAQLPQFLLALAILVVTWAVARYGSRLLMRGLGHTKVRRSLADVLEKLVAIMIWLGGLLLASVVAFPTLTPGRVITALGLGSIAIGFAFKDILENFLAGILILYREPFRLGDYVECAGIEGRVEEITIRDTHIRQTDGQRVVVPNATLYRDPVWVLTDQDTRRTTIICGIAYGEDVDRAREVIQAAVTPLPSVRDDREVQVFAQAFGESSIDFEVTWWTGAKPIDIRRSRDQVVAAVKRALDEAGIEIPFPYRTLTFKEPLALTRARDEGQE
ncbi:mechanosensitive ion channel family protein [Geminicoccus roseus]|uniref:mechanosensitive ion channel family protein n=1 Tax=Geminicoccus roseus TaxID=404900 RepID=UPI00041F7660|nr:mechanosensitive ion channel family protein [Geminicoccus roseus]